MTRSHLTRARFNLTHRVKRTRNRVPGVRISPRERTSRNGFNCVGIIRRVFPLASRRLIPSARFLHACVYITYTI